jgi:fructokinase
MIRRNVQSILNGYVQSPAILDHIDHFIVPPGLGNRSGILGAIALAINSM